MIVKVAYTNFTNLDVLKVYFSLGYEHSERLNFEVRAGIREFRVKILRGREFPIPN
jgi:hypothetical protein